METPYEQTCTALETSTRPDSERLNELFQADWDYNMREYPEAATYFGYPGQNDRWTDLSPEAIERRKRELKAPLKALLSINYESLTVDEQLSYALFRRNSEMAIEGTRFPSEYLAINQIEGVQQTLTNILGVMPKFTLKDFEDFAARLNAFAILVDQTIALLEKGLAGGITTPKVTLCYVIKQLDNLLDTDPENSPVIETLKEFPPTLPELKIKQLHAAAVEAVQTKVLPALNGLRSFLSERYIPNARDTIAMGDLPGGPEWYAFNVRYLTTTQLSPQEIHEIGLAEVKRINGEMSRAIRESGFQGSCEEFFNYLRTDSRFYYENAEDLLIGYRDICKRADPELFKLFGTLPRQPYGVKPIPDYSARTQPAAFYQGGSNRSGRPGYFLANTSEIKSRAKWEMEALALHEAVPGHHLQIALADEMENVPEFRRKSHYGAYIEGWGLYAERLGYEMGLYRDVYSRFGQLTYDIWRAIRLVVDTGIHALGWSRRKAIDFFNENAPCSEHNAVVEVDRYIVLPGQALTYKIGQLKISQLREWSARELGDRFDLRAFHDEVLRHGTIPLDVLETLIKEWVARQSS